MINEAPLGGTRRFLVKMNGGPYGSFDSRGEADDVVTMMRTCSVGGKSRGKKGDAAPKNPAHCATQTWSVEDRG